MTGKALFPALEKVAPPEILINQHQEIFNALKAHGSDVIVQVLQHYLRAILGSIKAILAKNTDWFTQ